MPARSPQAELRAVARHLEGEINKYSDKILTGVNNDEFSRYVFTVMVLREFQQWLQRRIK